MKLAALALTAAAVATVTAPPATAMQQPGCVVWHATVRNDGHLDRGLTFWLPVQVDGRPAPNLLEHADQHGRFTATQPAPAGAIVTFGGGVTQLATAGDCPSPM